MTRFCVDNQSVTITCGFIEQWKIYHSTNRDAIETGDTHLNRLDDRFLRIDGKRGTTGGPIKRSGPSCFCFDCSSITGSADIDQSELELELPGEFSLPKKKK